MTVVAADSNGQCAGAAARHRLPMNVYFWILHSGPLSTDTGISRITCKPEVVTPSTLGLLESVCNTTYVSTDRQASFELVCNATSVVQVVKPFLVYVSDYFISITCLV